MTIAARRQAAVLGGIGLAMIAGAIFWRLAPDGAYPNVRMWTLVLPAIVLVFGLLLVFRSGFVQLLNITRAERRGATQGQRAELSKMIGPSLGLLSVLGLAGVLVWAAPMADGRFGWGSVETATGIYLISLALLPVVAFFGTWLRLREIEILAQPS
ncbi:hypothetical protein [Brevundimonas sp. SH203]|uniref:hypothetical protein n=1 Tax=Brevundimonas sp. SH203 TaxID=345167 RepID=UPI00117811E6|nr:hypothetical protein [Brevundimonas sp. SH203]